MTHRMHCCGEGTFDRGSLTPPFLALWPDLESAEKAGLSHRTPRRFALLALGLLLLAATQAIAAEKEQPLPKDLPAYSQLKTFTAPQVTSRKLANGLTVWLVPRPGFPKVS